MKTSERLDGIATGLQAQRNELLRLAIDLPDGRPRGLVDFIVVRLRIDIQSLRVEAAQLRKWND